METFNVLDNCQYLGLLWKGVEIIPEQGLSEP
jgi:hypothetical protein